MNNNKIKSVFFKSIVDSDFLFLNSSSNKQLRHFQHRLNYKKLNLSSLDVFETLKSVKQLIQSLRFLSERKEKMLHIWLKHKQYLRVIDLLIDQENFGVELSIKNTLLHTPLNQFKTQLLLLLNLPLKDNKKNLKRIFNEKIFLINKINLKLEKNNWGSYKIYNDLTDFKKFLFLFILIDLIFTKTK